MAFPKLASDTTPANVAELVAQARKASELHKALLILHSPRDTTVNIDNAARIFVAAKHPKSFVSLEGADHLLNGPHDADFAAGVVGALPAIALTAFAVRKTTRARTILHALLLLMW